ncbi:MAG: class I SAM-dependent methyltransferase [Bdellovibrionota bacterium]
MTTNEINFLTPELLAQKSKVSEIDYWLSVLDWVTGWHYDLDIIWILDKIEALKLPKGATILDAGAGLGITQFLLAARGYNVLSLDFAEREVPKMAQGIFQVEQVNRNLEGYHHTYMDFMVYKDPKGSSPSKMGRILSIVTSPKEIIYRLKYYSRKLRSRLMRQSEIKKDHSHFGKISFVRGTFNNIPLDSNSVDLVVSVSAFEHNKFEDMPSTVVEFERVLKPGAAMLVTTSAAQAEDHFHKPSQGWCLNVGRLQSMFAASKINGNFDASIQALTTSNEFKKRIPMAYTMSANNGLPFGDLTNIKYVPVGIYKHKNS